MALDVARDSQDMIISLDWKQCESTLVGGADSGDVVMGMPALGMCDGDPAEDFRQFSDLPEAEEEMPMIRREAIGGDADLGLSVGLGENLFKHRVVSGRLKEWKSSNTGIQDVIGEVASGAALTAQHTGSCHESGTVVLEKDFRLLL